MKKWIFEPEIYTDSDFGFDGVQIKFILADSKEEIVEKAITYFNKAKESYWGKEYLQERIFETMEKSKQELDKFRESTKNVFDSYEDMGNQSFGFAIYEIKETENGEFVISDDYYYNNCV